MPPASNFTSFRTDSLQNPNFQFASDLEETEVADSTTPQEVAEQDFRVEVPATIPDTTLQGSTRDQLMQVRSELERRQNARQSFDEGAFEQTAQVSPFGDVDAIIRSALYGDREQTDAERAQAQILEDRRDTTATISRDLNRVEDRATEETGITEFQSALAETRSQIAQRQARFRREMRAFETDAELRGADRNFVNNERAKLEADAVAELADLSIIENAQQGNVEAARSYIDTAVNNRYRNIQLELQEQQADLDALIPTLEGEEKDRATQLQLALGERERNLENEKEMERNKRSYMLEVAAMGAGDQLQQSILTAPTEDQAALLTSQYIGRQMRAQAAAAAAGSGAVKAPTIKTINGVDYQWNEELGIWEVPSGVGGGEESVNTARDNLTFLRDTTARILGEGEYSDDPLYTGAGQAVLAQRLGRFFRGQTKTTRLEAQVDTLRANMLTLATDPSIKEFFGPQMSDADVRLMTAAGTTLRPDSQTPAELKDEAQRIDDLLNRMLTSLPSSNQAQNLVTAPDGTIIQIIDN